MTSDCYTSRIIEYLIVDWNSFGVDYTENNTFFFINDGDDDFIQYLYSFEYRGITTIVHQNGVIEFGISERGVNNVLKNVTIFI